jgi:hypothetical protein
MKLYLVLVVVLLAGCAAPQGPSHTTETTPNVSRTTELAIPTDTPQPLLTATPSPTPTSEPTPTPKTQQPTAMPARVVLSEAEEAYFDKATALLTSFVPIQAQIKAGADNPAKYQATAWRTQQSSLNNDVSKKLDEFRAIKPPAVFKVFHSYVLTFADSTYQASLLILKWCDDGDKAHLVQAQGSLDQAKQASAAANEEYRRIMSALPTPTVPKPTVRAIITVAAIPTAAPTARVCCKVCTSGKACGDSCLSADKTCHQPPGCACDP